MPTGTHGACGFTPRGDTRESNETKDYVSTFLKVDKQALQKGDRLMVWYTIRCNEAIFEDTAEFSKEN